MPVGGDDKLGVLVIKLRETTASQTLVFCNTLASCRAVEHHLHEHGFSVTSFHGGIPRQKRVRNFELFQSGARRILVCTDLAARGLDIPEVSHVFQFDVATTAVDYLHRAGRTARMGASGTMVCLVTRRDKRLLSELEHARTARAPVL